jgi:hypothetical protein
MEGISYSGVSAISGTNANVYAPGIGGNVPPPGSMIIATGIIRPSINAGVVSWDLLNDSQHTPVFFTSVVQSPATASRIRINYPAVSKVCTLLVGPDETFAGQLTGTGATVDVSNADIQLAATSGSFKLGFVGDGAQWQLIAGSQVLWPGMTIVGPRVNVLNGPVPYPFEIFTSMSASYNGGNNNLATKVTSGLGIFNLAFELRNAVTGLATTPQTTDFMTLDSGNPSSSDVNAYDPANLLWGQANANLWVVGVFIL